MPRYMMFSSLACLFFICALMQMCVSWATITVMTMLLVLHWRPGTRPRVPVAQGSWVMALSVSHAAVQWSIWCAEEEEGEMINVTADWDSLCLLVGIRVTD